MRGLANLLTYPCTCVYSYQGKVITGILSTSNDSIIAQHRRRGRGRYRVSAVAEAETAVSEFPITLPPHLFRFPFSTEYMVMARARAASKSGPVFFLSCYCQGERSPAGAVGMRTTLTGGGPTSRWRSPRIWTWTLEHRGRRSLSSILIN